MAKAMLKTLFAAMFAAAIMGAPAMADTAHDFAFDKIEGGKLPMSQFKGKAVLVVNTASFCGYTPQYEGLQSLWESYKDKGLVVLGVPANDFGAQEPGAETEIKNFCTARYEVTFELFSKVKAKGEGIHPVFAALTGPDVGDHAGDIRWNFTKFLVDKQGKLLARFEPNIDPMSAEICQAVEKALAGA